VADEPMWEGFPLTKAAVEATEPQPDDEDEPHVGNRILRMYAERGWVEQIAAGVYVVSKLGPNHGE
jgi:hypothetical protein